MPLLEPYATLRDRALAFIPAARLVTDPLRLLAWGTDASFYRLVPKIAVVVESEAEVVRPARALRASCARRSPSAPRAPACRGRRSATRCW